MFGEHLYPRSTSPIAQRLWGFMRSYGLLDRGWFPDWCGRRCKEAWPLRPVPQRRPPC